MNHNVLKTTVMWLFKSDLTADFDGQIRRLPITFHLALLCGSDFLYLAWFAMVFMLVIAYGGQNTDNWYGFFIAVYITLLVTRPMYHKVRLLLYGCQVYGVPMGTGTYTGQSYKMTEYSKTELYSRIVQVVFTDHLGHEQQVMSNIWTPLAEWDERPATVFYDIKRPSNALVIFRNANRDLLWIDDNEKIHLHVMPIALLPVVLFVVIVIYAVSHWHYAYWW